MVKTHLLLINDLCGYGKVATAAMLPILSYLGVPTFNLPTALVSNTLDYGKFNILDTTDYIQGVFPVWRQLGFRFDAIATGFIASERQARIISQYCLEEEKKGATIFVDPIMGDEGKLYNGVTPATIQSMREMVAVADLIYPNHTEACYLTGHDYNPQGVTRAEAFTLLHKPLVPNRCSSHPSPSTDSTAWPATITPTASISCSTTLRYLFTFQAPATSSRLC